MITISDITADIAGSVIRIIIYVSTISGVCTNVTDSIRRIVIRMRSKNDLCTFHAHFSASIANDLFSISVYGTSGGLSGNGDPVVNVLAVAATATVTVTGNDDIKVQIYFVFIIGTEYIEHMVSKFEYFARREHCCHQRNYQAQCQNLELHKILLKYNNFYSSTGVTTTLPSLSSRGVSPPA